MLGLRAEEPDGASAADHDSKGWSHGVFGLDELEARLEAGDVGHDLIDRRARLGKGSLVDAVVVWVELELNHLSHLGNGVVGSVLESTVLVGDLDHVRDDGGRGARGRHSRGGRARRHARGAARGVVGG